MADGGQRHGPASGCATFRGSESHDGAVWQPLATQELFAELTRRLVSVGSDGAPQREVPQQGRLKPAAATKLGQDAADACQKRIPAEQENCQLRDCAIRRNASRLDT